MIAVAWLLGCADTAPGDSTDTGAAAPVRADEAPPLCPFAGAWAVIGAYCGGFTSVPTDGWVATAEHRPEGGCVLEFATPTCVEVLDLADQVEDVWTWSTAATDGGCNDGPRTLPAVSVVPEDGLGLRVDADGLGWFDIEDNCPAYHAYFVLVPW